MTAVNMLGFGTQILSIVRVVSQPVEVVRPADKIVPSDLQVDVQVSEDIDCTWYTELAAESYVGHLSTQALLLMMFETS